jgi:hypothetical protein
MWGALSDKRMGLSFTIAAGQRSHLVVCILYATGTGWSIYSPGQRVPFSSPPTNRGGIRTHLHTG